MKKLLCILAIFAMAACSSSDEAEDTMANEAAQAEATATEAVEEAKSDVTEAAKAAPQETAADDMSSSGGEFPPITGTEKSSATCSNKGDTRMVKVLNITEGGCGVVYNKFSVDKTIAIAKHDMSFCDKVSENVQSNLSTAGFDCGGGAASTSSSDAAPAEEESSSDAE